MFRIEEESEGNSTLCRQFGNLGQEITQRNTLQWGRRGWKVRISVKKRASAIGMPCDQLTEAIFCLFEDGFVISLFHVVKLGSQRSHGCFEIMHIVGKSFHHTKKRFKGEFMGINATEESRILLSRRRR